MSLAQGATASATLPSAGRERVDSRKRGAVRLRPAKARPFARAAGTLLILAVWALLSASGLADDRLIPAPWSVIETAMELTADNYLWDNVRASLARALVGFGFGVLFGLALAVLAGLSRAGEALIDGPVQIKRAIPTLGLIPLMILWFGIGETMKIVVIATSVLVPIYINTHAAITGIDNRYVELAETLRLGRRDFIARIVLPGALPGFFVGLRLAATLSWVGLVVVEQINAESGIGYMMAQAQLYGQTSTIFVGLVIYGLLGVGTDALIRKVEACLVRWRRTLA